MRRIKKLAFTALNMVAAANPMLWLYLGAATLALGLVLAWPEVSRSLVDIWSTIASILPIW